MIIVQKLFKYLLTFTTHHVINVCIIRQYLHCVIRNFRPSNPDILLWADRLQIVNCFHDLLNIPDVTGKPYNIRLFFINICNNFLCILINCILFYFYFILILSIFFSVCFQTVHCQIGMNIFSIYCH